MKLFYLKLLSLIFLVFTTSCQKENQGLEKGTYSGTFKVVYSDMVKTGEVTLELASSTYNCSGNKNRIPAGGSGSYSFEKNKVKFIDKNVWTTEFDPGLVLGGEYNYIFDGTNLKLWYERKDGSYYEYDLVKTADKD